MPSDSRTDGGRRRSSSPTTGGTGHAPRCCTPSWARTSASPQRVLDVGSADGPSVGWLTAPQKVSLDLDPRGLRPPGRGLRLRARPAVRRRGVRGGRRVRRGRALRARRTSPWPSCAACSSRAAGCCCPCRRTSGRGPTTTSPTATTAATRDPGRWPPSRTAGFEVVRATYGFAAVFPAFVAERAVRGVRHRLRPSRRTRTGRRRRRPAGGRTARAGPAGPVPLGRAACSPGATCRSARRCSWRRSSGEPAPRDRAGPDARWTLAAVLHRARRAGGAARRRPPLPLVRRHPGGLLRLVVPPRRPGPARPVVHPVDPHAWRAGNLAAEGQWGTVVAAHDRRSACWRP